ncbi:MAG: 30S ribosomal protein S16 [Micrococcales bacterium]|nr:30S ribosomal protein S16 [Micrococcales bacterium]MCL2666896.1 30S ribosomal protein S16 [Micrococcales bacterium]
MATKIRLKRLGKIRAPYYRIVVADSRTKRDGRVIEEIGKYHPTEDPSFIEVTSDRAQYWLGVGAQPTAQVLNILKITGDWQKFKGLPGAEGTLKTKAGRVDAKAAIDKAAAEAEKVKAKASEAKAKVAAKDEAEAEPEPAGTAAPAEAEQS